MNEREIFAKALQLSSSSEQAAFLDEACDGNSQLKEQVESLLAEAAKLGNFLEPPSPDVAPTTMTPVTEAPGNLIGRYKLMEQIGEGGMGVVYAAEQQQPMRRRVALKVIKPGMDTKEVIARFAAERQALALMDHPNIAKVHDAGTTESGRPYFVMELVRGIPVTEYCDHNRFNTRERLDLFVHVCRAVQHAHQKGVIHRDIKPSNVLVTEHDGTPVVKIIDFGVAKAINQQLTERTIYTRHQQIVGTPMYMSPEQAELSGLDVDTRSDIYSLGVLLYELLTGTPPFDKQRLSEAAYDEIRRIIREEEPSKPSTKIRTLGKTASTVSGYRRTDPEELSQLLRGDLDCIVMKSLEKDRNRRYDTAKGLVNDIQRHLNDEPVVARPPSVPYRFQKAWRRNKVVYSAAVIVASALIVGTVVSAWQAIEAWKAQEEAEAARGNAVARARESWRLAYLADMFAVAAALENHNVGRARRLLEEYRPRRGEEDLRDFEWFHFDRFARVDRSTVLGTHPEGARALFAAPDGKFLTAFRVVAFGRFAGDLKPWDGSGLLPTKPLALDGVTAVALSRDGKRLAIARGLDIEIRPRDNPGVVETTLSNWHRGTLFGERIVTMCFCNHDTQLACRVVGRSQPGSSPVMLVDISADRGVNPVVTAPLTDVLALADSENGQCLAISHVAKEVVILRLPEASEVRRITLPYSERVFRGLTPLTFVSDDRNLVTTSDAGGIDIWEVANGRHVSKLDGHATSVTALACSPDGKLLASAGLDQVVKLWDLESQAEAPYRVLRGHGDEVWGVAFLPDGRSLVTCGRDESVRLWDLQQEDSEQTHWSLPAGTLEARLGPGFMLTGSAEHRLAAWDVSKLEEVRAPQPVVPRSSLPDVLLLPLSGRAYWLGLPNSIVETRPGWGFPLTLYRGRDQLQVIKNFPEFGLSRTGIVHSDGSTLFAHGAIRGDPHLLVWDLDGEQTLHLVSTALGGGNTMAVSPDASLVLLGSLEGGRLETLDLTTGSSTVHRLDKLSGIFALAVLPGNRFALAGGQPGVLCKVDLTTGAVTDSVPASLLGIHSMSLSPGATRLATGDAQGKVKLWDVETLREVAVLGTHPGIIWGMQFQPDGRTLLSVDNSELRIWRRERIDR